MCEIKSSSYNICLHHVFSSGFSLDLWMTTRKHLLKVRHCSLGFLITIPRILGDCVREIRRTQLRLLDSQRRGSILPSAFVSVPLCVRMSDVLGLRAEPRHRAVTVTGGSALVPAKPNVPAVGAKPGAAALLNTHTHVPEPLSA